MNRSQLTSGLFITFEGGEGAGKTTLIEEVIRALSQEGYELVKTREPGGTPLGEEVRRLLLAPTQTPMSPYTELALFLASRAQHIAEIIGPALEQKKLVLCDRFNDSTIAYQGAARGLGMRKVADCCAFISQGLEPHLTLYLDIDPAIGLERVQRSRNQDRIEQETLAFHAKIRDAFRLFHQQFPTRVHLLDASQPPAKVFEDAMVFIHTLLSKYHV